MNAIDGTEHYKQSEEEPSASLLVVILDTNPYAWAQLSNSLPLTQALANLLVFINAHLAFSHENRVAVIASHCQRAEWLYPTPIKPNDGHSSTTTQTNGKDTVSERTDLDGNANKYRPFQLIEDEVTHNLQNLLNTTTPSDIASTSTTLLAGALTLALCHINKLTLSTTRTSHGFDNLSTPSAGSKNPSSTSTSRLTSRILVVSTSGDLASQYIPIMNSIFAAQHSGVMIDILKLAGDTALLQQASYTTGGIFLQPLPASGSTLSANSSHADQLLQYLLQAFLPDAVARKHLVNLSTGRVDFRAACFCHRRVVDIGYVCSICLSIFCAPPDGNTCLTCGTQLRLGTPAEGSIAGIVGDGKKKKKKRTRTEELAAG